MRLLIEHRTDYRFSEPQARLVQMLRLTPNSHEGQNVVDWRIDMDCDARLKPCRDGFGNQVTMLYVNGPIEHFGMTVSGEVLTEDRAGVVAGAAEPLPPLVFLQTTRLTRSSSAIVALAQEIAAGGGDPLDRIHRLNQAVRQRLRFDSAFPAPDRDAATIIQQGHGGSQDFAHLFIAAARELGIPARYVSGYLHEAREGSPDRPATHGWAEAHLEGFGWIGFDPVHDICPNDAYVRVAIGLDYHDAAPLSGARTGGGQELIEVSARAGLPQAQTQS